MAWNPALLQRLNDHSVPFVIVGGVAAIIHGTSRITEDLDICAPLEHEYAVRIIRAFQDLNPIWRMRPDFPVIREDSPHLRGLKNMYLRTSLGQIDILGELPGVGTYAELSGRTIEMMVAGTSCQVVDLDTLIQSKQFAGRNRDKMDARQLLLIRAKLQDRGKIG